MNFESLLTFLERYAGPIKLYDPDTGDTLYEAEITKIEAIPADFNDCEIGIMYIEDARLVVEVHYSFVPREYD